MWTGAILLNFCEVLLPVLLLAIVSLGISALVHYVFACQRYIIAKGHKHASLIGVVILMFSFLLSLLTTILALIKGEAPAAYFAAPVVFTLSALPLKLLPDRSIGESF